MTLCIYKLMLHSTGKIYIGQSRNPNYRLVCHTIDLERGCHHNKSLQEDFNRFGGKLSLTILEELGTSDRKVGSEKEFEWIKATRSYDFSIGYNCNDPRVRATRTHKYTKAMREFLKSVGEENYDD